MYKNIKLFIQKPYRVALSLLIVILAITGCVTKAKNEVTQNLSEKKVVAEKVVEEKYEGFGHKIHAKGGEVSCKRCHMKVKKSTEAGMPNEMLCVFCHKTVYDGKPVGDYYNKTKWMAAYDNKRAKYKEIKMSHKQHISMGIKCLDCHGDVANSVKIADEYIPVKPTCFKCHAEWNTPDKCVTCHNEINTETQPPSHKLANFKGKHGKVFREESSKIDRDLITTPTCNRCHTNDHCLKCHQEEPPSNHTNQWRLVGHGITAGIDRGRCNTCHKTDFCFRCHENTRPKSHLAATWGNPRNQHCQSCHMPLNSTSCSVCHVQVTSHLAEAPGSHGPGWGNPTNKHCATCHSEAATCSVCHDGTPSHQEVAPATHTGQWGGPKHNHCVRCHIPISLSITCKVCHNDISVHLEEAPLRPDNLPHTRALMCRACHQTGTPTLIHADDGLECRICHKK